MILVIPRVNEKAVFVSAQNKYSFNVPIGASKQAVKQAVEEQFKVTVTNVQVLVRKGKPTRFSRGKNRYPGTTFRKDKRLAYVTLKQGDSIKIFDKEQTDESKKEETVTKIKADTTKPEESKKAGLFAKRRTGRRGDK
ncbi:MAG: 50S ribosomal protein L23 [Candidatus Nomurabacteria bacterium]|jgi:large subunit ribosomal protein L23|nr:50S ribosomal protein L23 [Candidatus Nomurabacteria bacterium]